MAEEKRGGSGKRLAIVLILGVVIGAVGAALVPRYAGSLLPAGWSRGGPVYEGSVAAKRRDGDRLLLTVVGDSGAVLATITKRVAEIELLVEVGDSIALALSGYEPFVTDPRISAVRKPSEPGAVVSDTVPTAAPVPAARDTTPAAAPADTAPALQPDKEVLGDTTAAQTDTTREGVKH